MLFVELQCVNHAQHFVDVTAQLQVVNDLVTNNAFFVDQERAAQCNASVRMFNTVGFLNFAFDVSDHRVFNRTDTAFLNRRVTPCVVNEFGVEGNTYNFYATFLEFFVTVIKSDQLRRTHEGEVHWPEENNSRFACSVFFEVEVFNNFAATKNCCCGEIWGWTSYQDHKNSFIV